MFSLIEIKSGFYFTKKKKNEFGTVSFVMSCIATHRKSSDIEKHLGNNTEPHIYLICSFGIECLTFIHIKSTV